MEKAKAKGSRLSLNPKPWVSIQLLAFGSLDLGRGMFISGSGSLKLGLWPWGVSGVGFGAGGFQADLHSGEAKGVFSRGPGCSKYGLSPSSYS